MLNYQVTIFVKNFGKKKKEKKKNGKPHDLGRVRL